MDPKMPFLLQARRSPAPTRTLRKGSNAQDAGTQDAGPAILPNRRGAQHMPATRRDRPFSSQPGSTGKAGLYALSAERQGAARQAPTSRLDRRGLTSRMLRCLTARHFGGRMAVAFVFPGQGSQTVGMGNALAEAFPVARAVFNEVDAALGEKLTRVMWEGPSEALTLTENAQPALMAVSLAVMRVLEAEAGVDLARAAQFVAGHSLGEYSALAAAGSLSIADTARLLRIRGLAVQKAVPVGIGAMAALLGLDYEAAVAVANEA